MVVTQGMLSTGVCVCPIVHHVCLKEISTKVHWVLTMYMAKHSETYGRICLPVKWWGRELVLEEVEGEGTRAQVKGHTYLSEARGPQEKKIALLRKFVRQSVGALTSPAVQGPGWGHSYPLNKTQREEVVSWEAKKRRTGLRHAVGMNNAKESTINE